MALGVIISSNSVQDLSEISKVIMNDLEVKLQYKKSDADDWTKVEDKALRKKLQNRLAKRKSSKSKDTWEVSSS